MSKDGAWPLVCAPDRMDEKVLSAGEAQAAVTVAAILVGSKYSLAPGNFHELKREILSSLRLRTTITILPRNRRMGDYRTAFLIALITPTGCWPAF